MPCGQRARWRRRHRHRCRHQGQPWRRCYQRQYRRHRSRLKRHLRMGNNRYPRSTSPRRYGPRAGAETVVRNVHADARDGDRGGVRA
ncbi:hypothetical protein FMEAI12_4110002 [Parafrankia sp. Ea1.12]|nr:hypothetical protein FMEAI12_4110002 [Parafrankia sp. Ea1.12]